MRTNDKEDEEYEIVPIGSEYFIDSDEDPNATQPPPIENDLHENEQFINQDMFSSGQHLINEPEKEELEPKLKWEAVDQEGMRAFLITEKEFAEATKKTDALLRQLGLA